MIALATKLYRFIISFGVILAPLVLLLVRLAWGWESFESGRGHLFPKENFQQTVSFFEDLHIPAPKVSAAVSGTVEMVGGIMLMAGLASRIIALPLAFNFIIAIVTDAHDQLAHAFSNPDKLIDYTAFPFLVASLVVLAFGPGLISLDGILKLIVFQKKTAAPTRQAA